MDPILQLNDLDLVFLDQSSPCHIAHHLDASSRQSAEVPAIKSVPLRVTTIKTQSQWPFLRHTPHTQLIHITLAQGPVDLL